MRLTSAPEITWMVSGKAWKECRVPLTLLHDSMPGELQGPTQVLRSICPSPAWGSVSYLIQISSDAPGTPDPGEIQQASSNHLLSCGHAINIYQASLLGMREQMVQRTSLTPLQDLTAREVKLNSKQQGLQ